MKLETIRGLLHVFVIILFPTESIGPAVAPVTNFSVKTGGFSMHQTHNVASMSKWMIGGHFRPTNLQPKDTIQRKRRGSESEFEFEEMDTELELPAPAFKLKLSEFNFDNPGPNTDVFIELEAVRMPDVASSLNDLIGYKLVVIRGEPLELVLAVDLQKMVGEVKSSHIVLGKSGNTNVLVNLNSVDVESVYASSTLLPTLDDSLYAVAIVFSSFPSELNYISLDKIDDKFQPKQLNQLLQSLIRDLTVDMQVVGRKVRANHCNFFDSLRPLALVDSFRTVLLRDWDGPNEFGRDFSLNNCCGNNEPFDPHCWFVGEPTPGRANDCSRKPIVLEEIILDLHTSKLPETNEEFSSPHGECSADYLGVSSNDYMEIDDLRYEKAVGEALEGRWACGGSPRLLLKEKEKDVEFEEALDQSYASVPLFTFHEDKFRHCQKYLIQVDKIDIAEVREWLFMTVFADKCLFSCHVCKTYFENGFRPDIKHKKEIVSTGYFSKTRARNKDQILDHLRSPLHKDALAYYRGVKAASTVDELAAVYESAESTQKLIFKPTMNAIGLSYAVLKAGVSFRAYPIILKGVQKLGVSLGTHHGHDHALQHFSETFSKHFHKTLLNHLVQNDVPFSLLADATTYKNVPYLVCLLQSIEDGHPIIYYWKLIELTKGESSQAMWDDIENQIHLDDATITGFDQYFKDNVNSLISDMASVMIGKKSSIWSHLIDYIGRDVPTISCSNHRLERVIHHALNFVTGLVRRKSFKYYFSFRDKNNKFYTFYMSFGSKRWAHLTETAKELGLTPHRIKYHFSIRWAASSKRAMETLYKDYEILVKDLQSLSKEKKTVTKDTRDKATELFKIISDKTFAITVAEFVDFLTVFEKMSKALQTKSALLIGKVGILRAGFLELRILKHNVGSKVTEFLQNCTCGGVCEESGCSLSQFDSCGLILKGEIKLTNIDKSAAKLSEHRSTLYSNLEDQLKKYFDSDVLEAFELFNPGFFKWSCPSTLSTGTCHNLENCYKSILTIDPDSIAEPHSTKFETVCNFFSFSTDACVSLIESWKVLLEQIVTSGEYEKLEDEDPSVFWPHVLSDTKISLNENLKTFLKRILVTGLSNSESERAFSIATRYKTGDRSSLSSKNLDALLRIAINGPDELNEKSVYTYTKEFLKTYSRVDDVHGGGRGFKTEFKNYFAKSRLF